MIDTLFKAFKSKPEFVLVVVGIMLIQKEDLRYVIIGSILCAGAVVVATLKWFRGRGVKNEHEEGRPTYVEQRLSPLESAGTHENKSAPASPPKTTAPAGEGAEEVG